MNAVRGDIADVALAGTLFAPHYARPLEHGCTAAHALIRQSPSHSAPTVNQLLRGEGFAVLDVSGGWAWGYSTHDHYVGYLPLDRLGPAIPATHIVNRRSTLIFAQPDDRAPFSGACSMGSRLRGEQDGDFLRTDAGFVLNRHIRPIADFDADPVTLAEQMLGTPYYWGARGFDGIDCSGLVQLTLGLAGIAVPRDTDQQQAAIGEEVSAGVSLQRGDIVFFPGHVGMMADASRLIHASGHTMSVVVEPLADVIARIAEKHPSSAMTVKRIAS